MYCTYLTYISCKLYIYIYDFCLRGTRYSILLQLSRMITRETIPRRQFVSLNRHLSLNIHIYIHTPPARKRSLLFPETSGSPHTFRTYAMAPQTATESHTCYATRNSFYLKSHSRAHHTSWGYMGFLTLSLAGCTSNRDCPLTEACIGHTCQEPCLVRNPCAEHAICINTNHGADCSCEEGYHGNGFSYCDLRKF